MTTLIKLRITLFALGIVAVALMMGWVALNSSQHVEEIRQKLTPKQFGSFQSADRFLARLEDLNSLLYRSFRDTNQWPQFLRGIRDLDDWIDTQTNRASTEEGTIFNEINHVYDAYQEAARKLEVRASESSPSRLRSTNVVEIDAGLNQLDQVSRQLRELDSKLLEAHQESMLKLTDETSRSLFSLRRTMFAALSAMLVLGICLALLVYKDMIAPLQRKLGESRAIIEQQEKLASLGVLAAGVAHEVRNPLTSIKARLYTLEKALRAGSAEAEDASVIGKEISRLERIVRDVLQFARPDEPRLVLVPAAQPLREIHELMAPQLQKHQIKLALEPAAEANLRIDPAQMKQVLLNLIQNAAESIERKGTVSLRARKTAERLGGQVVPAVALEVQDTGKGIPAEVQERLFDPFYTTKEAGTGLGLSIAARIVEKHGGRLGFQTQLNKGTTFSVVLPQAL